MQKRSARIFAFVGAAIGWFAVITQFYIQLSNRHVSVPETILRFFGYFTIDTNILAAVCFTFIFLGSNSGLGRFFSRASTVTALTVYITIVGLIYNVILRSTWDPHGMQKLVDELLHSVIPILFILFWLLFAQVEELKWKNALPWLIYPVIYMIYGFIHGATAKFYPYPFVNVTQLGYNKALLNAGGIILVMFFLSLALIGSAKIAKQFDDRPKKK